jgi:transcriptional regulator with XRE-family HTH domain
VDRERIELRKRVGAFVRARREDLGLSQGDVIAALGYVSRNSVSNIETGREGLPTKRVYAWADVLQLPHEGFFRFVTGESKRVEDGGGEAPKKDDAEVLALFRRLPPRLQRRARDLLRELAAEAKAERALDRCRSR